MGTVQFCPLCGEKITGEKFVGFVIQDFSHLIVGAEAKEGHVDLPRGGHILFCSSDHLNQWAKCFLNHHLKQEEGEEKCKK